MAEPKEAKIEKKLEETSGQNEEGGVSESDLDNISGGGHSGAIVTLTL
jgi:hypothetical protein